MMWFMGRLRKYPKSAFCSKSCDSWLQKTLILLQNPTEFIGVGSIYTSNLSDQNFMQRLHLIPLEWDLGSKSYESFQKCQVLMFTFLHSTCTKQRYNDSPASQISARLSGIHILYDPREERKKTQHGFSELCSWGGSDPRKHIAVPLFSSVIATALLLCTGLTLLWWYDTAFNLLSRLNSYLMQFFCNHLP